MSSTNTSTLHVSVYIHHCSPPLWGIVVNYITISPHQNVDASNVESELLETAEDEKVLQQTCPEELRNIQPEDVSVL